jgi:GNAT superfamily N-acetyltransferase/ribosomal protein S18 acetylase RimI-like enzyme
MRAHEFLYKHRLNEDVENFPIANVRRPNGAIGNQGVNIEQAADVLTHAAGMQVSPDMSMRQLVDALQADPAAQQRLRQFVQQNPITVYALPDGSYHLQDGHHRTFLLNLLGDETVPAVVKEGVTEAKTVEFEGLTLKVIKQGHELVVDALDDWGNKVLGHVKFNIGDGQELDPQDLEVDERYQGQGIARVMYDYVKSLGYTIVRSPDQTDAGAGFWNKHRGEDVRVWESFLGEANASAVQFQTASTDNYQSSFTVTAIANGKTVGHFSFFRDLETDDVHNQAEVTDDVQGKGYGKALLLKAIEVANDHGLGFQEDSQSLSRAQSRVYDSLYDAGWIVDADGYWFLTPEGEQELARLSTIQQGVAEAPLADYQPIGDFDKPGPFRGADKKLIPHPVNQLKAQRFFEKTPYNFRLFFSNIPGTGKYSEYGIMDPDTVKIIFGDAGEQIVAGHENAITVVYVGNSGDSKVMLTPWMMAHRLGHAIQVGARGQMRNQQQPWKAGEDHFFGQVNSMLEEYYGKSGQPGGNLKAELTPEYNALFNAMGTQRSSRSGEIRRPYEFLYEIFAQYLGTGTVTFNALPANLGYGRRVWGNPSRYLNIKPEYRDETVRKQAAEVLSYDMELMFNDALSNVEGKILVM